MYTDTSGVRRFDLLREAVRRAGPRKILFGSDGPWLNPGVELHKVRLLGLSRAATELVTGGNVLALISEAARRRRARGRTLVRGRLDHRRTADDPWRADATVAAIP